MWLEKVEALVQMNKYARVMPPAEDYEIKKLFDMFGDVPSDLIALLKEANGDGDFLLSVDQIIETNLINRQIDGYMPLDCILFFAHNGFGDHYGYGISKAKEFTNIYFWDHEFDSRTYVGGYLEQLLDSYLKGEI
jgi:hypothetical protein